ncbi:MAG TPA: asparagine synthase (glutamine-hydrolyzing) [Steroidobacter sp.]|nr:asparagine synthase (glutamine-hydrolyzing) [Steroidobacter sp.]
MCGLAGFLSTRTLRQEEIAAVLPQMAASLAHRGPDDQGFWSDAHAGIALCHRRLSIIDLSAHGHQPMTSPSRRYTIVYNGEIYNFPELRRELLRRGFLFSGGSDTEVLLAAVDCWGVDGAIERSSGMFAFALWDRQERILYLARDRFGEKPLYFGVCGDTLLFGSELKALRRHPSWPDEIDRDALALLMRRDFIPTPYSIFKGVRKAPPGCFIAVRAVAGAFRIEERRYWRLERLFDEAALCEPQLAPQECVELVDAALTRAVERQMLAHVPVGAFLSGGTDSSLVVAMMRKATSQRVKTFSVGFTEAQFDESRFARAVAQRLGTDHTELLVTARECLEVMAKLPQIYDEPFADPSQIPTYLVCNLARSAVTVALSGDGGDELFGGYRRYALTIRTWRALNRAPRGLRASAAAVVERMPLAVLETAMRPAAMLLGRSNALELAGRLYDQSSRWKARSIREFYRHALRRWRTPDQPVLGASPALRTHVDAVRPLLRDDLKQMMHLDTCEYLPDDILVKIDRAAMAVSLETRVPFLDPEAARAAWRAPSEVLMHDGRGKWVLRELLRRHLPDELVDRPKAGFAVPIADWLRTDLRAWAAELLAPARLRAEGYLDAGMVTRRWRQHQSGEANWAPHLWNVLVFQAWLEDWRRNRTPTNAHAARPDLSSPVA